VLKKYITRSRGAIWRKTLKAIPPRKPVTASSSLAQMYGQIPFRFALTRSYSVLCKRKKAPSFKATTSGVIIGFMFIAQLENSNSERLTSEKVKRTSVAAMLVALCTFAEPLCSTITRCPLRFLHCRRHTDSRNFLANPCMYLRDSRKFFPTLLPTLVESCPLPAMQLSVPVALSLLCSTLRRWRRWQRNRLLGDRLLRLLFLCFLFLRSRRHR